MNKQKLNIKQWSKADRPREKMMAKGSEALSDAELLGILITRVRDKDCVKNRVKRAKIVRFTLC